MNYYRNNCTNTNNSCSTADKCREFIPGPQGPQGVQGIQGPQGPRGERGPQGPRGAKGDPGRPGPTGPQGLAGSPGVRGPQGDRGESGPKGDAGPMGPQGIQGIQGPIGPQGDQGPVGPIGNPGTVGPIGPRGEQGEQGERGITGLTGLQGEQGLQGETGPQGISGNEGPQGPRGEQGPMGPTGLQGDTGPMGEIPTVTVGNVTSAKSAQVTAEPTRTGVILNFVTPMGPTGPQGEAGETGEQGPQGETGVTGPQGPVGAAPDITVGSVTSGNQAEVTANSSETGVSLDLVTPIGPRGLQGPQGEMGPQGETGSTGPQGPTGIVPDITVGRITPGRKAEVTANVTETGISLDFVTPAGPTGPQGEQGPEGAAGPKGAKGETGPTGPDGTAPSLEAGALTFGDTAQVTANTTENGYSLDFAVIKGSTGPKGTTGPEGDQGPKGIQGNTGATGPAGSAPRITAADEPTSYHLSFPSEGGDITSPNLKAVPEHYDRNLAAVGSSVDIPLGNLILTAEYKMSNQVVVQLSIAPADAAKPVTADIRCAGLYNASTITNTLDNNEITAKKTIVNFIYSNSNEIHWVWIRQKNPDNNTWSMCEVDTFASRTNARTSVYVKWLYRDSSFEAPTGA